MITAITTAPRPGKSQLPQVFRNVIDSGFPEPFIFAEPGSDLSGVPSSCVIQREELYGCYRNYRQMLQDLIDIDPDADTFGIFQDDIQLSPGCFEWLQDYLWPHEKAGVISLYSPDYPGYEHGTKKGFNRQTDGNLIGACAFILHRGLVDELLKSEVWRGSARHGVVKEMAKKKAVDAWVGNVARETGWRCYFPNPSLCQHIAEHSSVGHGETDAVRRGFNYRKSKLFSGQSPRELFGNPLWRYDSNGKLHVPDKTTIIIPGWNLIEKTERCLHGVALQKETFSPFDVIYVDNGSEPGVVERVEELAEELQLDLRVIRFPENRGFTAAVNAGLEQCEGHALLLNNDCYMHEKCLQNMMRHLLTHGKAASVGPLTNDQGAQSIKRQAMYRQQKGKRKSVAVRLLSGFCQLKRKSALETVGHLDSNLPHGLGTDDDWCKRATAAGLSHHVCFDAFADHDHKSTFEATGQNRRQHSAHAKEYLKNKVHA